MRWRGAALRGLGSMGALVATAFLLSCGTGTDGPSDPGGDAGSGQEPSGPSSDPPSGGGEDNDAGDADGPRTVTIGMQSISFVGPTGSDLVTIKLGERIRWVNRDGTLHTATAESVPPGGKGFNTGWLEPGSEYVFQPNVTGTWVYSCLQYPDRMFGARIRVVP